MAERRGVAWSDSRRSSVFHSILWRGKTDLDRRIWLLRIHDYGLGRLHIHELVLDLFYGLQGKFLIFSHFEFPTSAPGIKERGDGLRRGGDLFLHQCDLCVALLMFEEQLRNIDVGAVLIARVFFREVHDLEVSAPDDVADLQELRRLALVDAVDAEFVFYPRRKHVSKRLLSGRHQM